MTGLWDQIALLVVGMSCAIWMARGAWPRRPRVAVAIAALMGGAIVVGWGWIIAVVAPFGVVLPAVAAQSLARVAGVSVPRWSSWDLGAILGAYGLFLMASMGVWAWDVYALGYDPIGGAGICAGLIALALWRGQGGIAAAIVIGQAMWTFDVGPENVVNMLTHVALVPVIAGALIWRAVRSVVH